MAAETAHPAKAFGFGWYSGSVNIEWDAMASMYRSDDPRTKASSLFELRSTNGFMPTHMPVEQLPGEFRALEQLLQELPANLRVPEPRPGQPLISQEHGLLYVGERIEPEAGTEDAGVLRELRKSIRKLTKTLMAATAATDEATIAATVAELRALQEQKRELYHAAIPEARERFQTLYKGDRVDADLPLYAAVEALPNLEAQVRELVAQPEREASGLIMALFRDYSFLLSAYVFEPCHWFYQWNFRIPDVRGLKGDNTYGYARAVVPPQIAQPLKLVADALGNLPFMEYQQAWGLNNWKFVHDTLDTTSVPHFRFADGSLNYAALIDAGMFEYDNIDILRPSVGTEDERGFAVVHIQLEAHTSKLITAARSIINAAESLSSGSSDAALDAARHTLQSALHMHAEAMKRICEIQHEMWKRSKPSGYLDLRTFIYGVEGNMGEGKMFPEQGLCYEFTDGPEYLKPRGESGANSSIIPAADTLLGVVFAYPENKLTKYLSELRSYRPLLQRDYLRLLGDAVTRYGIVRVTPDDSPTSSEGLAIGGLLAQDPVTKFLWLLNVSLIRRFRLEHFRHTAAYILPYVRGTSTTIATGGTPILTFLPNQLGATLRLQQAIVDTFTDEDVDAINVHFAPELAALRTYFEGTPQLPDHVVAAIENAETAYDMLHAAFTGTVAFCRAEIQAALDELSSDFTDQ